MKTSIIISASFRTPYGNPKISDMYPASYCKNGMKIFWYVMLLFVLTRFLTVKLGDDMLQDHGLSATLGNCTEACKIMHKITDHGVLVSVVNYGKNGIY